MSEIADSVITTSDDLSTEEKISDDLSTEEKISSRTRSKSSNSWGSSSKINTSSRSKCKLGLEEKFPQVSEIFKHKKDSRTEIESWLSRNSVNNKNVIYINSESITAEKLCDLCNKNIWLSSDHINAYFSYLSTKYHNVFSLPSFFYTKLTTTGKYDYNSVVRWTKKTETFKKEIIFVPIILDESHWILAAIFMRGQHRVAVLDSLGILSNDNAIAIGRNLIRWLNDEYGYKLKDECKNYEVKKVDPDLSEINQNIREADSDNQISFTLDIMFRKEKPPQTDGSSCGVFVCMFARLMAEKIERDIIIEIAKLQEANKKFRMVMCTDLWEHAKENGQLDFKVKEDNS